MDLPQEDWKSHPNRYPFLNIQEFLGKHGFPVPRVHAADLESGFIAVDDWGDQTLEKRIQGAPPELVEDLYGSAVQHIIQLQNIGGQASDSACVALTRAYDAETFRTELEHFSRWFLFEARGIQPLTATPGLDEHFDALANRLMRIPTALVHRDFQSRNLMIRPSRLGGGLGVIDFQDALVGPQVFDIVALLRDSYVELTAPLRRHLVEKFSQVTGRPLAELMNEFHLQTLQRKLKDVGRFHALAQEQGKTGYLAAVPRTLAYIREAFESLPETKGLHRLLAQVVPEFR